MDPVSVIIILSIGNFVAWLAALYVKDAARGLIGHVVVATTGAFIAGYLTLWLFPNLYVFGMITGAFLGAVFMLYFVRLRTRRLKVTARPYRIEPNPSTPNWSEMSVREQIPSIIAAIVFMGAIFLLLGWYKLLQIRDHGLGFPG
jgi:uncharacterized membrane protein YeaQ/YmgE (transglycosylase-associated protein family)